MEKNWKKTKQKKSNRVYSCKSNKEKKRLIVYCILNWNALIVLLTAGLIKRHSINEWMFCRTEIFC